MSLLTTDVEVKGRRATFLCGQHRPRHLIGTKSEFLVGFSDIREQAADRKERHRTKKSKSKHRRKYDSESESEEERRRRKKRDRKRDEERSGRREKDKRDKQGDREGDKERERRHRKRSRSESQPEPIEWVEKGGDVSGDEVGPNLPTNIIGKDGKIDRVA